MIRFMWWIYTHVGWTQRFGTQEILETSTATCTSSDTRTAKRDFGGAWSLCYIKLTLMHLCGRQIVLMYSNCCGGATTLLEIAAALIFRAGILLRWVPARRIAYSQARAVSLAHGAHCHPLLLIWSAALEAPLPEPIVPDGAIFLRLDVIRSHCLCM